MNSPSREKLCTWCKLPKFGDERCVCDNPKFELMEECDYCGTWREVDHLHVVEGTDEAIKCTGGCIGNN